jgi:hypothetical protein
MSLRELPPGQGENLNRWRHVRYVPLVILVILAIVAAGVGLWVKVEQRSSAVGAPSPVPTETVSTRLPELCAPPVDLPEAQPWSAENAAASEQVWADHAAELGATVEGRDDWVFWGDVQNNNFSQALGRRYLSPDELAAWHTYFANLDTELSAAGIELYIVVAPAKWAVYPQELPEWSDSIRGTGPLDQLVAGGADLPLVDLRAQLQDASAQAQTFSRVNSHWTSFGAYEGWNAVAECITANQPDIALAPIPISGVTVSGGFNEYPDYGIEDTEDWTAPEFVEPLLPVELSAAGADPTTVPGERWTTFPDLPAETETVGAQSDDTLLFVGDSFGVVLSPYLQQAFAHTRQVRHNLDGDPSIQPDIASLALATRPDVVIFEITQRHLNAPPVS